MPYFKWTGVTIVGDLKKGKLIAHSVDDLQEKLFQRGVALLRSKHFYTFSFLYRVTPALKAQIFSSVSQLLKAGMTIPGVFLIAAQQLNNPLLYDALFTMVTDIISGTALVTAIKQSRYLCDPLVVAMVRVGHESGNILQATEHVASYYYMRHTFKKGIRSALAIPLLTFIFFIGVMLFIFLFIMPRFAEMFLSLNSELPVLTRYMISISTFVSSASMVYASTGALLCIFLIYYYTRTAGTKIWNIFCMHIPFVGRVIWNYECGQSLYALSLLLESNITLLRALEIIQSSTHNYVNKHYFEILCSEVQSGTLLSQAMFDVAVFRPDVIALIKVGEESGNLAQSLQHAGNIYKDSAQSLLNNFLFFVQPVVIIILGLLIGMLILAVYLPIMNLSFAI